jgi:hypothetical protein
VLAKHVAQVFYVPDTTNKILKVVIPRKQWIVGVLEGSGRAQAIFNLRSTLIVVGLKAGGHEF